MKYLKTMVLISTIILVMGIALVNAGDEGSWFDMANCDFCKNLIEDENLLPNMTWEHFITENGMITVTTYKPEVAESYGKCIMKMEEVGKKLEKGEDVKMCNFCIAYGDLMMAGAKFEYNKFSGGDVTLISSTDPAVVEKIHKFAQRTLDEYAKMAEMDKDMEGHEGHNH